MRRTLLAALLAVPTLLVFPGSILANPPKQCYYGPAGCGGKCLLCFPRIHQIGPLFNYGPYYGYPPFEPYGPWNSYLQYTGPYGYAGGGYGHGHFGGDKSGHGALCGSGFGHASWSNGGWFHGHGNLDCGGGHGWFHKHGGGGCATGGCQANSFDPAKTDAVTRYAGAGDPASSNAYYTGLPTLVPAGGIVK